MPTKTRKTKPDEIPYVLKDKYLQVTIEGRPFSLDNTHPTFARMKKALKSKNWKAVPKLVTLAQNLISASQGNVEVKAGVVYYKGTAVDDSLTARILEMVKESKPVQGMMKFMNNLYQNPEPKAIREFFDWLRENNLPITDDGCFLAYKSVDSKLKDEHTHKIDNSPGQVIWMPRVAGDSSWRTQCSSGFHICSKQYGLYGSRVMAVKANPRDVLSAVAGKMRVLRYEVLFELGGIREDLFKYQGFSALEKRLVVEIKAERKELVKMLLDSKQVKRLLRAGKIKESTITKSNYGRLKTLAQKYEVVPQAQPASIEALPPLAAARKASGFTVGQIAKAMKSNYKAVVKLEKQNDPNPNAADAFLEAIGKLKGVNLSRSAITYPISSV
jgi:hypothetical protein